MKLRIMVFVAMGWILQSVAPQPAAAQPAPPGQGTCERCAIADLWCTWEGEEWVCYESSTKCFKGYAEGWHICEENPPYGACTVELHCSDIALIILPDGVPGASPGIVLASVAPCNRGGPESSLGATILFEHGRGSFSDDPRAPLA
jgi:hypothetical protein